MFLLLPRVKTWSTEFQFMNKVLYAREGARSFMDRTLADFPWQVRVEVDGVEIEVPEVCTSFADKKIICIILCLSKAK